ncbi:M24 family metallopeptidase [Fretibacterium sp. OH1220_COT-178]|nr:M24 family metallopeptidase [Fretibacterium sp. OH1220_COT-178]
MAFDAINQRLSKLRGLMRERDADAFVLFVLERLNSESCHYISGFRGSSAALIIDQEDARLITDGRYRTQAVEQSPFSLTVQALPLPLYVAKAISERGWRSVAFEAERISHGLFEAFFRPLSTRWVDASAFIPSLRRSKDRTEADAIRRAAVIARKAYDLMLERVEPGMTEADFESQLLCEIKKLGGEKGWAHDDFIVASGARGAMCHARATRKPFGLGETVTLDYGVMVDGYMCDITRNFAVGHAQPRALELNDILLKAHREAAAALRPGVAGRDVDAVARKVVTDAGYGEDFVHGLGHGLGLEIHEAPRLSALSRDVLQVGDVVTIEPGIYIEGWGGLRIEDDYIITETGAECLTLPDDQSLRIAG